MGKGKNKNGANTHIKHPQSGNSPAPRSIDLSSVNNLIDDNKDKGVLGALGDILSKTMESEKAATDDQKQKVAEKLEENISQLVGELKGLIKITEEKRSEYQSRLNTLEQREEVAEKKKTDLENDAKQLVIDRNDLKEDQKKIADQRADIVGKLRELAEKEQDAEHGFFSKNEEMLEKFRLDKQTEAEIFEKKKEVLHGTILALEEKKLHLESEFESTNAGLLEKLRLKGLDLHEKDIELGINEEINKHAQLRLKRREKALEDSRDELKEEIRSEFLFELDSKEAVNASLFLQIEKYQQSEKTLKSRLDAYKELQEGLDGEDPSKVYDRIQNLQAKIGELQNALDLKPSDQLEEQYKRLKADYQNLENVLLQKEQELSKESKMAAQLRMSAVAQETLAQEKLSLIKANEVLKERHKTLRQEVDEAMADQESKSPFPTLLSMDNGTYKDNRGNVVDHRRELPVEPVPDLARFASELRHRIAWDAKTKKELFYSETDIRIFIAGLAMSRLHILQGISGTGKTSLALAFARAVGGYTKTVAVQAGWRDKDDLIGHYNSFEKKFYERACLEGLYEAQTPLYKDRPYIILLDEMNLSRPEQYFSEFLSAMEQDKGMQFLDLMTEPVKGAPIGLNGGRKLEIPHNVWFVGTANHDETTFEFADKTYDRSHVMELPRHEENFDINKELGNVVYSVESLESAFQKAQKQYSASVAKSLKTIYSSDLVKHLREDLDVSWGNRFERQADRFVSTMKAAGGKESEAFDHLLATKVFRSGKATGRYDTERDDIETIKLALGDLWGELGYTDSPVKSLKLLDKELQRKGA